MIICPICTTDEERACKYKSQEAKIMVNDEPKKGETLVCLYFFNSLEIFDYFHFFNTYVRSTSFEFWVRTEFWVLLNSKQCRIYKETS